MTKPKGSGTKGGVENIVAEKPCILVVDDEAAMRESIKDWLMEEGHEVALASDGESAISMAGKRNFDVILLDLKMPGMEGLEALKRLKDVSPELEISV